MGLYPPPFAFLSYAKGGGRSTQSRSRLAVTGLLVIVCVVVLGAFTMQAGKGTRTIPTELAPVVHAKYVSVGDLPIGDLIFYPVNKRLVFRLSNHMGFIFPLKHHNGQEVGRLSGVEVSGYCVDRSLRGIAEIRFLPDKKYRDHALDVYFGGRSFADIAQFNRNPEVLVSTKGDIGIEVRNNLHLRPFADTHLSFDGVNLILRRLGLAFSDKQLAGSIVGLSFGGFGSGLGRFCQSVGIHGTGMHFPPLEGDKDSGKDGDSQSNYAQSKRRPLKPAHALLYICELLCSGWLAYWRGVYWLGCRGWCGIRGHAYVLIGGAFAIHGSFSIIWQVSRCSARKRPWHRPRKIQPLRTLCAVRS